MSSGSPPLWASILLLVVGAAVGFVPSFINERKKESYLLRTRWDQPLLDLAKDLLSSMRTHRHLCERYDRATDKEEWRKEIEDAHLGLRVAVEELRLIASKDAAEAAVRIRKHSYWLRAMHLGDGLPQDVVHEQGYDQDPPVSQLESAVVDFVKSLRHQLGVPNPDDVQFHEGVSSDPLRRQREASREADPSAGQ